MLILLGNGENTETFSWPCGANSRTLTLTNNMGEQTVLDCENPLDAAAVIERWTESQDTSLQISGVVAKSYFGKWRQWADDGDVKNIRIELDETLANGGGHYTLPALLGSFEMGQEGKAGVTFTASISGAGPRVWTPASA